MTWTPETLKELVEARLAAMMAQLAAAEHQIQTMQDNWNRRFGQMEERITEQLEALRSEQGAMAKRLYAGGGIVATLALAASVVVPLLVRH
jgi:hypothetical protein